LAWLVFVIAKGDFTRKFPRVAPALPMAYLPLACSEPEGFVARHVGHPFQISPAKINPELRECGGPKRCSGSLFELPTREAQRVEVGHIKQAEYYVKDIRDQIGQHPRRGLKVDG